MKAERINGEGCRWSGSSRTFMAAVGDGFTKGAERPFPLQQNSPGGESQPVKANVRHEDWFILETLACLGGYATPNTLCPLTISRLTGKVLSPLTIADSIRHLIDIGDCVHRQSPDKDPTIEINDVAFKGCKSPILINKNF